MASSVCKSLQYLTSALTQGGEGDHFFRFTCSVLFWGGRNPENKYHWHVWGVLKVSGPHWVSPQLMVCVLSQPTLLRLQVALQGNCLRWALVCMDFPGLCSSGSGSQVLHKGTNLGLRFVPSPGPSSMGDQVLGNCTLPSWAVRLITSMVLAARFPRVRSRGAISGVPWVSSGELISGCNPPGGCQPSSIPGRLC